jgi:dihydrolipoamide dehydrogenase
MHSELVVLGGGPGGYAAAFLAADGGMEVALVDAEPRLGGTCLLRGCIPSKALLHVARVLTETGEMRDWGVQFGKPKIDVDALRARKEKVVSTLAAGLKQLAKQRKVKVVSARGTFLNSTTLILEPRPGGDPLDDLQLTYDHCILATGSRPTRIPALDLESDRVMDSTGSLELPDIPETLLVIGGGYIGLEMGTVYAALGSQVSVVELTPDLLPGVDRDLVKPLHKRLEGVLHGIHLETKVAGMAEAKGGGKIEVRMEGPDGARTEKYDRVLVSVGRRPNSDGIGLENTQVVCDKRGFVQVDEQRRTIDPHILAIGDVAGEPMLAHKATHEGKVAVEALLGEPAAFDKLAIPAVVFTDPEIAWAGLTETQAKEAGQTVEVARYPWAASGRAQSLGRTEGLTKVLVEPETQRVLGVGIVGPGAGDLISEAVLAIEMGCTLRDVAESIHPHPTLSETLGNAAEMLLGTATEIYRPKRPKKEAVKSP